MSSQAQVAANQSNGRKSRGPRTAAGKSRASRNALRHGLAAISRYNPAYFPEIDRIAKAYCEGDNDPLLFEQALIMAECDLILMYVAAERLAAIARMRDPKAIPFSDTKASLARARARFAQAKFAYAKLVKEKAATASKSAMNLGRKSAGTGLEKKATPNTSNLNAAPNSPNKVATQPRKYDEVEGMLRAVPDLKRLERYERRAISRRNRAMHEFSFIRSLRAFQADPLSSRTDVSR
jgi:hypothetical protein